MKYRYLGRTGVKVSELCLGALTFGNGTDEKTAFSIMDRFVEVGGNFIDTANVYSEGRSEKIIGKWLKEKRREEIVIGTKFRFATRKGPNNEGASRYHLMSAVEQSLHRLNIDTIDIYYIHCWDPYTPIQETLHALNDLVQIGKIRYIGASNFAAWQLMKMLGIAKQQGFNLLSCVQPQYNLISRTIEYEVLPACIHEGLAVMPWSPLGGGFLTGKYSKEYRPQESRFKFDAKGPKENVWHRRATERNWKILETVNEISQMRKLSPVHVAISWVLSRPGVTAPIIGAKNMDQLNENLDACNVKLHENDLNKLNSVSAPDEDIYPYRLIREMGER